MLDNPEYLYVVTREERSRKFGGGKILDHIAEKVFTSYDAATDYARKRMDEHYPKVGYIVTATEFEDV